MVIGTVGGQQPTIRIILHHHERKNGALLSTKSNFHVHTFPSLCDVCTFAFHSVVRRSRGERIRSPVLFWIRVFLAESCACRYLSIMVLCFLLSFSLHQTRSQYCSTCGRFDGPISCKTSLNHALAELRLAVDTWAGHGDHTLYLLSRDKRSDRVSACKMSSQKRDRVWVNPCSRDRHT